MVVVGVAGVVTAEAADAAAVEIVATAETAGNESLPSKSPVREAARLSPCAACNLPKIFPS
ncbi:MAG: hypothetical protein WA765_21860, partial [Candidatus Acidiferrum sp.]